MSKEFIFSDVFSKSKLPWVASKVYMNHFRVHAPNTRPNVLYASMGFMHFARDPMWFTLP